MGEPERTHGQGDPPAGSRLRRSGGVGVARALTPIGAAVRGALAGTAATGLMTAAQLSYYKVTDTDPSSTPAEVARRIVEGVLHRDFPEQHEEAFNQGMHWLYGTSFGVPYAIVAGSRRHPPPLGRSALAFGLAVWGVGQVQLPAMQLAPPPWRSTPSALAMDLGFHLVYGLGGALAFRALR